MENLLKFPRPVKLLQPKEKHKSELHLTEKNTIKLFLKNIIIYK